MSRVCADDVFAPPYDVLTPEMQTAYRARSEYNIVNVDFRPAEEGDARYEKAAALLDEWTAAGTLVRDSEPAMYLIETQFTGANGKPFRRKCFIALLRLEDLSTGTVFPHEKTFPKQKQDRLKLLRATRAHINPVFSLYSDPGGRAGEALDSVAANAAAEIRANEDGGILHKVWRIRRPETIGRLQKILMDKSVFIADGHHRYETALNFAAEIKKKCASFHGDEAFNYVMMAFVRMEDEGLEILSAHRMMRDIPDFRPAEFLSSLADNFVIEASSPTAIQAALEKNAGGVFGVQTGGDFRLLRLREGVDLEAAMPGLSKKQRRLDVSIAQELIIARALGGEEETDHQFGKMGYNVSFEQVSRLVGGGEWQAAVYLAPTKVSQLMDITSARELMPHKSTYFHPKMPSGAVTNRFTPDERIGGR